MYKEHPDFKTPPQEALLWRYLDFTKFIALLDASALFFVRADKLGDPFEGTLSPVNLVLERILYPDKPGGSYEAFMAGLQILRRYVAVNCWHRSDYESAAMWSLYAHEPGGIAVKTNLNSLVASFTDSADIYIGEVNYVDYNNTFIPDATIYSAYLHKRKSFEHEREVRAVIMELPADSGTIHPGLPDVWEVGRNCSVDIATLVHAIVVSPFAPKWFMELVQSVVAKYNLHVPVVRSSLADPPM